MSLPVDLMYGLDKKCNPNPEFKDFLRDKSAISSMFTKFKHFGSDNSMVKIIFPSKKICNLGYYFATSKNKNKDSDNDLQINLLKLEMIMYLF